MIAIAAFFMGFWFGALIEGGGNKKQISYQAGRIRALQRQLDIATRDRD
jgi:hypothetical protein